jgi:predicted N-formylglutamate amidohydrolase/predicted GIY-YIG superfamily endonuclease
MSFWVYMLRCADGLFYTGHTDNLDRRLAEHQSGIYAGFTHHRRPVELVWSDQCLDRETAFNIERQIKGWSRLKKKALIEGRFDDLPGLSKSRPNSTVLRQAQHERVRGVQHERDGSVMLNSKILLIADHASNAIPPEYQPWGMDEADMARHIAWDIGTAALACALAAQLNCPAIIAPWSRLLIDLNRDPEHSGLIPTESDGSVIPRNADINADERSKRLTQFFHPYHNYLAEEIAAQKPALIVSLHSFTPVMNGFARPWHVGLLYNKDDRAARQAIDWFRQKPELVVGDNEPYSGRDLNYTMNRHAEAAGIPYISLEIRQDYMVKSEDISDWTKVIAQLLTSMLLKIA